jgi:predicted heme/steroid binding protein
MKFKSDIEIQAGLKDSSGAIGTSEQLLTSTGSGVSWISLNSLVPTVMNSRVEVNFTATSGQTTFTTPYEVGQIDVYYNGSKLNPSEFTATNGTTVVLAQAATLNAQISIVKYIGSINGSVVPTSRTITINGESYDLSANRAWSIPTHNAVSIGSANGLSITSDGQVLSLALASAGSIGALSANDWMTFNSKIGGSGTTNFLSKFTASGTIGNSLIFDNGANVGIGTESPTSRLTVNVGTGEMEGLNLRDGSNATSAFVYSSVTGENRIGGIVSYAFPTFYSGGSERMRITSSGNVGIGTTNPSTRLDVNGAITASGGFFNSDIRLKDLIDYDYNVLDIKPISYLWKDGRDNKKHVGYSAQDVQKVMPDAVNEGTDGMLSVNYVEVLVAKIAELENKIKRLEKLCLGTI